MRLPLVLCMLLLMASIASASGRDRKLLDFGWKFHLGSAADMAKDFNFGMGQMFAKAGEAQGPVRDGFNDSGWREVNLPHDFVVEGEFVHLDIPLHVSHGSKPAGRLFPDQSIGWYRKSFSIPKSDEGRRISVEFDGVYRDSMVWINGHLLGREASGYSSFSYDLTDFLNYDDTNTLVVRADTSQYEGWFYEGGGIYRHVWLVKTPPVHIPQWGTFVSSEVAGDNATITVRTEVANESDTAQTPTVTSEILDPNGHPAGRAEKAVTVEPRSRVLVVQQIPVSNPKLWDLEAPNLYTVHSTVATDTTQDQYDTTFGIRTILFDQDRGFFLNGKRVELQGTCNHQDHAGVGVALPDRLQYFRIQKLKEMGCNAYRTSHNAPTPELLEACDRLGMLVMDENRLMDASKDVHDQFSRQIRRDRNHPSVIIWSIGNEEYEGSSVIGARLAKGLVQLAHELDPTRLTTYAGNNGTTWEGANSQVDVRGFNYITLGKPDPYHKEHPEQPILGSEEMSTLSTRGEYKNDPIKGYVQAYDKVKPGWGTLAEEGWSYYADRPYLAGVFVWTGFDYRGEPTPYQWPCINSHFGILDTCGYPKDLFYYYQSWWGQKDVLHILPHWNWKGREGEQIEVWCFSNLDEVEFFVNGKSAGKKPMPKNGHVDWNVVYQPGSLEAVGYRNGKEVKREIVATTGEPAKIVLTPDRTSIKADSEDVSVFTVSVLDSQGRVVPHAENDIDFEVEGGKILGVGNGDPSSHENDQFIPTHHTGGVSGWKMQDIADENDKRIFDENFWATARVLPPSFQAYQLPKPNTFAAFRGSFTLDLGSITGPIHLSIAQIDDFGWIYINGKLAGETKDWDKAYSFDIRPFVKQGQNEIVIVVKNTDGRGGLDGAISISYADPAPQYHRRVFHGLAQLIVQSTRKPETIRVRATSKALQPATAEVRTTEASFRGYEEATGAG